VKRSVVSRRGCRIGLDEHHVGLRHPASPQVEAEPPFAAFLVETGSRSRTEVRQVVLGPGLVHVGGNDDSVLHGRGRQIVPALCVLHGDRLAGLEVVGAWIQVCPGGEEDVSVLQNVAERDLLGVGKATAVRPGAGIVFGKEDLAFEIAEGLVATLAVDIRPGGLRSKPMFQITPGLLPCWCENKCGGRTFSQSIPA